ncbi:PLP-dependent aminotransferase family protein [Pendulispora albinea]|uniref:PLP-dependent aminotransferase family protein n=1 Tax=Pendulispora albinea TaxID=2741071 RepID=A0ABZ2LN70_9BACT
MSQDVGLSVDPRREEPIYRQIFDQVVARIQTHAFPPGFKLPPTRVLARTLSTHRNTVARAYADLEAAGFVCSTVGRGTFVEEQTADPARAPGNRPRPSQPAPTTMAWSSLLSRASRVDIVGRAERMARFSEGRDIINLARMQPSVDLLPDDLMRRCIERVMNDLGPRSMSYAPPEGVRRLREQIALDLNARGVPATMEDILVTSGSQQGLDLVARALINPGETMLVNSYTYSGAIEIFSVAGARLIGVPNDAEGPDLHALERFARADVKGLYLMPNGHNPTGLTISTERRHKLVRWSHATGIPLIEDDFGAGLSLDAQPLPPPLRALDGDVIHLSTFSKRLIPALRVGFVVCPRPIRTVMRSLKRVSDLGTSTLMQNALAEFMERGYLRAHMNRLLPEYQLRRNVLEASLRAALPPEIRWNTPFHGVVLWLRLPRTMDADRVAEEAYRHGVMVSPSSLYSVEAEPEPALRATFCSEPPDRLAEGAKRLGKAFKSVMAQQTRSSDGRPHDAVVEVV